ncbi:hypothetical protein DPEC_G00020260 [Dallia pectoralis]|uniref:Uncharacterized protein n=1 Tax=Dallia pectoralis TaxID=75939 RepID=A0ACC2HGQ8_DALPE|nr:hypothetical protein DPEC_G00020260 [Dallia pectoralis]
MSWAEEDWTLGLSGRVLQKVKELQVQQDRLNRERQQKQLQLDSTQTSLNKQTVKYEQVRGELQSVQRELQAAREEVQTGVCARDRLAQDLQVKQAQVCSLEGQLASAHTLTHSLEKEVKRLEVELEKLQNSSSSGDSMFSTPCWSMTSPWDHNGGRQDGRQGHRGEGLQARQQLKFSDHGESPSFPRQQPKGTPHRLHQSESSTPSAVFPWERDDPKISGRGRPAPPPSPSLPSFSDVLGRGQDAGDCGMMADPQRGTDMTGRVVELQGRVCAVEGELKAECERVRQTQDALASARKELTAREQSLQKTKEELSLAHTRISQEVDRAQTLEQRLKQLQEELKCQRQNSESSRLQHQQRSRDLEKQHQRDLSELQKESQAVEKQHRQDMNKLNQEIQQARTLYNVLQAQSEKVAVQKQALQRDVDTLKQKLTWTEGEWKESQKKEAQIQAKLAELLRESKGQGVALEQSRRRERGLEEEVKRLADELAEALRRIKELEDQKTVQLSAAPMTLVQFSPAGQSFAPVTQSRHDRPTQHTPSAQPKRVTRVEQARAEERGTTSYPTEREPGEGIDSEHVTAFDCTDSEKPPRTGPKEQWEGGKGVNERRDKEESVVDGCIFGKEVSTRDKNTVNTQRSPSPTDRCPHISSSASSDTDYESETLSSHSKHSKPRVQIAKATKDFQVENQELRSELQDIKNELQRRLEDLETQRRAEAEARTKLKQLSRKRADTSREKEGEEQERRKELEERRAETARLKEALAAMEMKVKREREKDEEKEREREDRESESMLLNLQLKKQLAELKTALQIEREEREMEKAERKRNKETEGKIDTAVQMEELLAEIEELKNRGRLKGKNVEVKNSPLTYLTLHSEIQCVRDNKLSTDEQHHFCEPISLQNTAVSQATATTPHLVCQDGTQEASELPRPICEGETSGLSASDQGETRADAEKQVFPSNQGEVSEETAVDLQRQLAQEVERLRVENASEAGRARHTQAKLEALQSQVTSQTQQLTLAFGHQSRHIEDLLAELQEKEAAVLKQEQELQHSREELATLREERRKQERKETERRQEYERKEGKAMEEKESRSTERSLQAVVNSHRGSPLTQSTEAASVMEEDADITMKPVNPLQASSALNDVDGQNHSMVTQYHYVTDQAATLGSHTVKNDSVRMEDSDASAQSGVSGDTVENTENFKVVNSTGARSNELMEPSEGLKLQHIIPGGELMTDVVTRLTEELHQVQRHLNLARAENQRLTTEIENASIPTNKPVDTSGQDGGERHLSEELQSLKQENQLLLLKLQAVTAMTVSEPETTLASNTTTTPTLSSEYLNGNEDKKKEKKRENQNLGKDIAVSNSQELEVLTGIDAIITSGQENTVQDAGKLTDEGRSDVQLEVETETVLDTTQLTDEGRSDVQLEVETETVLDTTQLTDEGRSDVQLEVETETVLDTTQLTDEGRSDVQLEVERETETVLDTTQLTDEGRSDVQLEVERETETVLVTTQLTDEGRSDVQLEVERETETVLVTTQLTDEGRSDVQLEVERETETVLVTTQLTDEGRSDVQLEVERETETVLDTTQLTDEGRSDVQLEVETETVLDTTQLTDEGRSDVQLEVERETETVLDTTTLQITCLEKQLVALQAELQSLSEENLRQSEELAVWRLTTQTPCLDSEELVDATDTCLNTGGHKTVIVIKEDELVLSCTSGRLYGRTLGSRIQHCHPQSLPGKTFEHKLDIEDGLKYPKSIATHYQETEEQTKRISVAQDYSHCQHDSNEHNVGTGPDTKVTVTPTPELQTKTTEPTTQNVPKDETELDTVRTTDEMKTTEIALRPTVDVIEVDDLKGIPSVAAVGHETNEPMTLENKQHSTNREDPVCNREDPVWNREDPVCNREDPVCNREDPVCNREDPVCTRTKEESHSSVCKKTTTVTTTEWKTERTVVENRDVCSEVTPAGDGGQERVPAVEMRSTNTQTEEGAGGDRTPLSAPGTRHQYTQTEEEDEEPTESPPMSPVRISQAEGDRMLFSGSFPIPADPARLAERIRRNRSQMSAAYDDTEYEPYGLPEVVMKGFADIPSGPACPTLPMGMVLIKHEQIHQRTIRDLHCTACY